MRHSADLQIAPELSNLCGARVSLLNTVAPCRQASLLVVMCLVLDYTAQAAFWTLEIAQALCVLQPLQQVLQHLAGHAVDNQHSQQWNTNTNLLLRGSLSGQRQLLLKSCFGLPPRASEEGI